MTYDNGPICPHCGGQTHYYDKAKRIVKGKYGESKKIYVYRYRCSQCGEIHRVIPDTLIPFKHYEKEIIQGVMEGTITPETLGFEDYPSEAVLFDGYSKEYCNTNITCEHKDKCKRLKDMIEKEVKKRND